MRLHTPGAAREADQPAVISVILEHLDTRYARAPG
jgi:hypothetical protein